MTWGNERMTNYFKYQKKIQCKDTGEVCIGYVNYLKSKHWMLLRTKLIQNHPYCEVCESTEKPLQLHHLTYSRLGRERDSDLVPLCNDCHILVHQLEKTVTDEQLGLKPKPKIKKPKAKKKKKSKSKKVCKNCRSFGCDKKTGKHYCMYDYAPIFGTKKACKHYSTLRYASWCRKKPF